MHTLDVHAAYRERQKAVALAARSKQASMRVLARIEHRVRKFLSETEKQIAYGQVNADIFERNRRYVDAHLTVVSPQAFEQVTAAYRQAQNGGSGDGAAEARSQALLSCRRALKSIADAVFPPTGEVIVDSHGRSHEMSDDKWRNRLVEFTRRKIGSGSSGEVLESQLADLGRRFKGLSEASSRGVHAEVTEFELNQTVIQTYLTIGDLLRLHADESGLAVVAQGLTD
jgi:hypothetical protein